MRNISLLLFVLNQENKKRTMIMITNKLNEGLIEAIKEKIPANSNIANVLMDNLFIGREAVYRRLRGEVPFTLTEAAIISRKLGVSLDKMIGVSFKENTVFDMNVVHHSNPFETYYDIINKYTELLKSIEDDPISELATSSNTIPQTLYLKHDILSKFRLFKWMYQNENIGCKHFDDLEIPAKLQDIQKDFVNAAEQIHSTSFIWDSNIFSHIVNDLEYFSSIQLISDKARQEIKEELLLLLDELENFARKGKFESDNEVNIYISNINFEATYSYVESSNVHLSMIRVYAINSITTQDIEMCKSLKEWIQSLKKFSTLISVSGELQRIQFFQKQREIIDTL